MISDDELRAQFTLIRESVMEPKNAEQIVLLDLSGKALRLLDRLAATSDPAPLDAALLRTAMLNLWESFDFMDADWIENGSRIISAALAAEYQRLRATIGREPQP
jgi:hypothetical protein